VLILEKLNVVTKKDPYSLPFMDEVINIFIGHEFYTFLDKFFRISLNINCTRRQAQNRLCNRLGAFVWVVMPFGIKNGPPTY